MKVYAISRLAKPKGRYQNYALLDLQERDAKLLNLAKVFHGRPFPREWKPLELYNTTPLRPKADFYGFGGGWVCSERAVELAGEPLEMCGELLTVSIQGESGRFFIFNCTNCMNVLDPIKSQWSTYGPDGEYKHLDQPAFYPERFDETCLFKIPEDGASTTYCLQRSGEADEGDFKAIVELHSLTGLKFDLVWSQDP